MNAAKLVALYKTKGLKLATAESCTGGLVAGAVTADSRVLRRVHPRLRHLCQ